MNTIMKNGPKLKLAPYRKILERKAEEVRNSMSAQKAAQVVARLDVPSDEGDLSQQHHEEWIFLNRNTIDMKLLREVADALHRIDAGTYGIRPAGCALGRRRPQPAASRRVDLPQPQHHRHEVAARSGRCAAPHRRGHVWYSPGWMCPRTKATSACSITKSGSSSTATPST